MTPRVATATVDRPFYLSASPTSSRSAPLSTDRTTRAVVATGTAVIAVTYGLGRYAYGLFVPELQASLGLGPAATGVVGGLSHVGYAVGLVAAPVLARRFGPGRTAGTAAVAAAAGLTSVAASRGATSLGAAVLVAGFGSGLASPALAEVVVRRLAPADASAGQTWINSGTSLGLAVSAPPLLLALHWRTVWAAFAVVAAVVALAAWRTLTDGAQADGPAGTSGGDDGGARGRLLAFAAVLGATSAAYWTFSRQQVLETGTSGAWSVGFWVAIGIVGLLGGSAGATVDRRGWSAAARAWGAVWACSLGLLALPSLPTWLAIVSASGFGAAYMALTGLTILWAVVVSTDDAAAGVRACFLALGIGQAVATPLAGVVADELGLTATFALSAAASLVLLGLAPTRAQRRRLSPAAR